MQHDITGLIFLVIVCLVLVCITVYAVFYLFANAIEGIWLQVFKRPLYIHFYPSKKKL